jgi:hypothetical protein
LMDDEVWYFGLKRVSMISSSGSLSLSESRRRGDERCVNRLPSSAACSRAAIVLGVGKVVGWKVGVMRWRRVQGYSRV